MRMDLLTFFNLAVMIISALGGWFLRILFGRMTDLENADKALAREVNELRVALPTSYVSKADAEKRDDAIFNLLRRLEDRLNELVIKT